jgi:CubicO group peptidase (beta-lactamase class C family)
MQLVEAGEIELDAPVQRYVPWFRVADPDASEQITVRHLLNHSSGLPATAGGEAFRSTRNTTPEQAVRELEQARLAHPPGDTFQYSNSNYVVLGLVVQEVSGQSYGEYVTRHIFEPLDMDDSYVLPDKAERGGMASGHRYWFGLPVAHQMPFLEGMLPAGYIISSAEDMGHYLMMYLNDGTYGGRAILSQEGIAEMHRPAIEATLGPWSGHHTSAYGMGWYRGGPWGEEPAMLHRGAEPNFTSMMVLLPERETGVVVLMNAHNELPPASAQAALDDVPSGVVKMLLGQDLPEERSLRTFYLVFDLAALLILGGQAYVLLRLLRRRRRLEVHSMDAGEILRAGLALLPLVWELGLGVLLLSSPALIGLSWPAMMLWMPDLTLLLAITGGLFLILGAVRLYKNVSAVLGARRQRANTEVGVRARR